MRRRLLEPGLAQRSELGRTGRKRLEKRLPRALKLHVVLIMRLRQVRLGQLPKPPAGPGSVPKAERDPSYFLKL